MLARRRATQRKRPSTQRRRPSEGDNANGERDSRNNGEYAIPAAYAVLIISRMIDDVIRDPIRAIVLPDRAQRGEVSGCSELTIPKSRALQVRSNLLGNRKSY
jgi:hypothetical protein